MQVREEELESVVVDGGEVVDQVLQLPHAFPFIRYARGRYEVGVQVTGDEGVRQLLEKLL